MKPGSLELDGLTSFPSRPMALFRFVVTVEEDTLNVWLEDRKSKKQWQSGYLPLEGFVSSANAIPGATLIDYAKCFKSALDMVDATGDAVVERDVSDDAESGLKLTFIVHLRVFEGAWSPVFSLTMKPVALDRIDFVEARLCDVEHEMSNAHRAKTEDGSLTMQLELKGDSAIDGALVWKPTSSATLSVDETGKISVLCSGMYLIVLEVVHRVEHNNAHVALRKDGREIYRNCTPYAQKSKAATATTWALQVSAGKVLTVIGTHVRALVGSKMVMMKIGGIGA